MNRHTFGVLLLLTAVCLGVTMPRARAEKIRDLVSILGAETIRIQGKGIVTGLNGTGDKSDAALKMLRAFLVANDYNVDADDLSSDNIALVNIDAEIPPYIRPGQTINLRITSIGDASSLDGGVLHSVGMRFRPGGDVIVQASGRVTVGTHLTSGHVSNGGQMLRALPVSVVGADDTFTLNLLERSYADAAAIARAINTDVSTNPDLQETSGFEELELDMTKMVARALDAGAVIVSIPTRMRNKKVEYISEVLNLDVAVSPAARVLVNRQTNTVVITGEVRVDPVAISHRNLSVTLPARDQAGSNVDAGGYQLADGTERRVVELNGPGQIGNLQSLINTLNAMGVSTQDVIIIVEKLKAAGALHAELIVE